MRCDAKTWPTGRVNKFVGALLLAAMSMVHAQGLPQKQPAQAQPQALAPVATAETPATQLSHLRGFEEALVPFGTSDAEADRALLARLQDWLSRNNAENTAELDHFVRTNPKNAWTPSLALNLGLIHYHQGRFSQALEQWQLAWDQGRHARGDAQQRTAQRAYAEMLRMYSRVGRKADVARLLDQSKDQRFSGPASGMLTQAREALWLMDNEPGKAFMCGPLALRTLLSRISAQAPGLRVLDQVQSPRGGFDMASLAKLSEQINMPMVAVKRARGTPIPVPSVLHWKLSHYAAVVEQRDGRYHLIDPTFGNEFWVSQAALDEESSGYMLVPRDLEPGLGLQSLAQADAARVFGMGVTTGHDDDRGSEDDCKSGSGAGGSSAGMSQCAAHTMMVSLTVSDTPLSYVDGFGRRVDYRLTYNHRDTKLPANANFSNFGAKWSHSLLSWIQDDGTATAASVTRVQAGGGAVPHSGYSSSTGEFARDTRNGDLLVKTATAPIRYELRRSDGSVEVFAASDGGVGTRRVFLSQRIDPQGRSQNLSYDSLMRLTQQTDASGLASTFSYGSSVSTYLITRITDPYGRHADFTYHSGGYLASITDAAGLVSSFTYDTAGPDRMVSMTNPYGTTQFLIGEGTENGPRRWLEITDPDGRTERLEAVHSAPGIATSDAAAPVVPGGLEFLNGALEYRNSFYWDAETYHSAHNSSYAKSSLSYMDYTKARRSHYLHAGSQTSAALESTADPLGSRIWYQYPGQFNTLSVDTTALERPSVKARVLDDGSTWYETYVYNDAGLRTLLKDSNGREIRSTYDSKQIDLLSESRVVNGVAVPWARYTYNSQHQPLTVTDRFGRTTTYAYNSDGQVIRITGHFGDAINYTYTNRRLTQITRNSSTVLGKYEYDSANRLAAATDAHGLRRSFSYDNLDRLLTTTYPDGTTETISYDRREVGAITDRDGRGVQYGHDGRGHTVQTLTSDGRSSASTWYGNDKAESETDPLGKVTTWQRDLAGRVVTIRLPDGNLIGQSYDSMGRLLSVTDPKNNVTRYGYAQNNLTRIESPDSGVNTATYDTYGNVLTKTDAKNQTTSYSYDSLSRPVLITYADGQQTEFNWDSGSNALGQLSRVVHTYPASLFPAGSPFVGSLTYSYSYDVRGLLTVESRVLPNGQSSTTNYNYDAIGRLSSIVYPSARTALRTYNIEGRLSSNAFVMAQGAGVNSLTYSPGGNALSGTWARWNSFPSFPSALNKATQSSYDTAGRLQSYTVGDRVISLSYDLGSRLTGQTDPAAGATFYGYDDLGRLLSQDDTATGIAWAYDSNGNRTLRTQGETTNTYVVDSASNQLQAVDGQSLQHDANGAVIDDGRQISYDARGFVIGVQKGAQSGSYLVDPFGRRAAKLNGDGLTSFDYGRDDKLISEKRPDGTRLDHLWHNGRPIVATTGTQTAYVYTDQLGTPRLLRNAANGAVLWQWGSEEAFGANAATGTWAGVYNLRFPGQYYDKESGLHYNRNRYYDPGHGRYVQSDPIGLAGGSLSLYAYVGANPLQNFDELGLDCSSVRGVTTCSTPFGPTFSVPTPPGFPDSLSGLLYHSYDVVSNLKGADPDCVRQAMNDAPTPGRNSHPATPGGTANDARVFKDTPNPVISYLARDAKSGRQISVNITIQTSQFKWGYVTHWVEDGIAHTSGEGNSWVQAFWPDAQAVADYAVWGPLMNKAVNDCLCGK